MESNYMKAFMHNMNLRFFFGLAIILFLGILFLLFGCDQAAIDNLPETEETTENYLVINTITPEMGATVTGKEVIKVNLSYHILVGELENEGFYVSLWFDGDPDYAVGNHQYKLTKRSGEIEFRYDLGQLAFPDGEVNCYFQLINVRSENGYNSLSETEMITYSLR